MRAKAAAALQKFPLASGTVQVETPKGRISSVMSKMRIISLTPGIHWRAFLQRKERSHAEPETSAGNLFLLGELGKSMPSRG